MMSHAKEFGYDFLPAVFESYGALGNRLAEHMQTMENEYLELHEEERVMGSSGSVVARWRERFSVVLQNSMCHKIVKHCNNLRIPLSSSPFVASSDVHVAPVAAAG
jgi:hypothetical protein